MPKKGYKQSQEHKKKLKENLKPFLLGDDSRRLKGVSDNPKDYRKLKSSHASWKSVLKSKFNMSEEDYYKLLEKQDCRCAICGCSSIRRRLAVDHSHDTGIVRGLLCTSCNIGIGALKDNKQILQNAIQYLDKYVFSSIVDNKEQSA